MTSDLRPGRSPAAAGSTLRDGADPRQPWLGKQQERPRPTEGGSGGVSDEQRNSQATDDLPGLYLPGG